MNRVLPSNNWASTASVSRPVTSGSAARPIVERARPADPAASPESHMNSRRDTGLGACMTYLLREQQSGSIGLGAELFFLEQAEEYVKALEKSTSIPSLSTGFFPSRLGLSLVSQPEGVR